MSTCKLNMTAVNQLREGMVTQPIPALVDSGPELTWLPAELLKAIGITPRRERFFTRVNHAMLKRPVGDAIVRAEGYETTDEIVFAEPGDMTLLGVRTLEGFGVAVDNIGKRFIAAPSLVVSARLASPGFASR